MDRVLCSINILENVKCLRKIRWRERGGVVREISKNERVFL